MTQKDGLSVHVGIEPELVELVKALARATAARDIAASRKKESDRADGNLRSL